MLLMAILVVSQSKRPSYSVVRHTVGFMETIDVVKTVWGRATRSIGPLFPPR